LTCQVDQRVGKLRGIASLLSTLSSMRVGTVFHVITVLTCDLFFPRNGQHPLR